MAAPQRISVYDSQTSEYHRAFQVFLDHTDQKVKAQQWLNGVIETLPARGVFIDVGAGNGKVTSWFIDSFERTIATEPNDSLRAELKKHCPQIEVLAEKVLETKMTARGDFILCSHVFYYIDGSEWMATLDRIASWLSTEGVLALALQHHKTDCMEMVEHFFGRRFDLTSLARNFQSELGNRYEVAVETVPARIVASDFDSAYTIAEFMLNLLPMADPPARSDLEKYVRSRFSSSEGGFRFSCDQDFLRIRRRR